MAKYMVIQREHEAQDIKSVTELPLTVQQQLSMKTGTLDEVHKFIDENNLLDEDVFVIPFVSKLNCTIGKYAYAINKLKANVRVDNASNSIEFNNRIYTFVDITSDSNDMLILHFFELKEEKGLTDQVSNLIPELAETLTIVINKENTCVKEIRNKDRLIYADYIEEDKRGN